MRHFIICLAAVCVVLLALGCSRGDTPILPGASTTGSSVSSGESIPSGAAHRDLWGWWGAAIDPVSGTVEIVPMRTAMFRANVTQWMQAPKGNPANLAITIVDASTFMADGRIAVDVALRHPFPGLDGYTGFDVHGIFMHDGPIPGKYDPSVAWAYEAVDAAVLENADGYTRWWNFTEFTGPMPILGFTPGALASLPDPSATLNPYKYFAHDLSTDEDVFYYLGTPEAVEHRGYFLSGSTNTRRYELQFPMDAGEPVLRFQYAVSASWEQADPGLYGDPDILDVPEDFPMSAGQQEAVGIRVDTSGSTLYYVDPSNNGGSLVMDIEVYDRQAPYSPSGAADEVSRIVIESPGPLIPLADNIASFEGASLEAMLVPGGGTALSSVWHIEVPDCNPTGESVFPLLVTVESADPNTYDQGYGQGVPDSPLAAYQLAWVAVGDCVAPVAYLMATTPTTIHYGESVEFDASASTGTPPLTFEWDWDGDGTWDEAGGPIIAHQFDDPGDFYVGLRVSNDCGDDVADDPIHVRVMGDWNESWPLFQYDEKCSGVAPGELKLPLTLKWDVHPKPSGMCDYPPAVAEGKVFYVDDNTDLLIALDEEDGSYIWEYPINPENDTWGYWSGPGYHDGRVFCGGNNLYCLDAENGDYIWEYGDPGHFQSFVFGCILIYDGIVYGPQRDGTMFALDESDGSYIWSFSHGSSFVGCIHAPAIAEDVAIWGGTMASYVYGRNRLTGAHVWQWTNPYTGADRSMRVPPTVNGDRVYFGAYTQHIFCLDNQTGAQIWDYPTPGNYPFNAGVFYDGAYFQPTVNFTSGVPATLYAINEDGSLRWEFDSPGNWRFYCDVVASGGYIFCADYRTVRAINATTGGEEWSVDAGDEVRGGFAVANNCLYLTTVYGHVICYEGAE